MPKAVSEQDANQNTQQPELAQYCQELIRMNRSLRKRQHDYDNHFISLQVLLSAGNLEAALVYINQLMADSANIYRAFDTGNFVFDAFFSAKQKQAAEKHVRIEPVIQIKKAVKISDMDWSVLFGNLLDNAIEAVLQLPEEQRIIYLTMKTAANILSVCIKNRSVCPPQIVEGTLQTGKPDKNAHGFGIENVLQVIEKYDGAHEIEYEDGWFSFSFVLCDI